MNHNKDEAGQALIELIIFLPLMFTLYAVISGFANAINGSINQQKVTRAYFYYRAQNNSTIPKPQEGGVHAAWGRFGMFFIGWKESFQAGTSPVMPCYKVSIPMKAANADKCGQKYTTETTQFVRVGTVYGICGATYKNDNNVTAMLPDLPGMDFTSVIDQRSCLITQ
jgi:hypothetical protein